MTKSNFFISPFLSSHALKDMFMSISELLGGINQSACLLWGFAASLAIILLIHQYGKFEIS